MQSRRAWHQASSRAARHFGTPLFFSASSFSSPSFFPPSSFVYPSSLCRNNYPACSLPQNLVGATAKPGRGCAQSYPSLRNPKPTNHQTDIIITASPPPPPPQSPGFCSPSYTNRSTAMISYHGHRPVGRTRFSIVVNPPRQPEVSHSTSRRPSSDCSPPSFDCSPPDSGPASLQPSPRVSDPDLDIRLPPPLVPLAVADCGPITPPLSSQVASRITSPAAHPGSMLHRAEFSELLPPPSNWDELLHSITAYIDSGATLPATTHMDDALWQTFIANLDPGDRYSPLYRLR